MADAVTLSPADQQLVQESARRKHALCAAAHTPQRHGRTAPRTLEEERDAYGAEVTVARLAGLPWTYTDAPNTPGDLGPGEQVRHTRYADGHLLLRRADAPTHRFWLVTGAFPTFVVRGWIRAADGRRPEFWSAPDAGRPSCYMVPQWALTPLALPRRPPGDPLFYRFRTIPHTMEQLYAQAHPGWTPRGVAHA